MGDERAVAKLAGFLIRNYVDRVKSDRLNGRCRVQFHLEHPVAFSQRGSRAMMLGNDPDPQLTENLSNEKQVTAQTPPTFLFHMAADKIVPPGK